MIRIGKGKLTLGALRSIAREGPPLALEPSCIAQIEQGSAAVERILASGKPAYGINTGFGRLSQTRIPAADLEAL